MSSKTFIFILAAAALVLISRCSQPSKTSAAVQAVYGVLKAGHALISQEKEMSAAQEARLAELRREIERSALERRARRRALDADERRETDAAHEERLDAIEANWLRLGMPPPEE